LKIKKKEQPQPRAPAYFNPLPTLRVKEETEPLNFEPTNLRFPISRDSDQFTADVPADTNFFANHFMGSLGMPPLQNGSDHEQFVSGDTPNDQNANNVSTSFYNTPFH
jgi:hypothetical protein